MYDDSAPGTLALARAAWRMALRLEQPGLCQADLQVAVPGAAYRFFFGQAAEVAASLR